MHALEKIYKVLKPEGVLLNIQPDDVPRPIEIRSGDRVYEAGKSEHQQKFLTYRQAMETVERAAERGLFLLEKEEKFSYLEAFDTIAEMEEYVGENWQNSILPEDVLQRARELEQEIEGETMAAINEGVLIQRLRRRDK